MTGGVFAGGARLPVSQPLLLLKRGGLSTAPLTRIGSLAAGRHRLRCRSKAELPEHSKLVHDSPVLGDLAVDDLHDVRLRPLRVLPGGRHPKGLTLMGAADRRIARHEVTFGNLEIDAELQVLKSFAHLRYDCLESLAARWHARGRVAVLFDIGRDDLVDHIKASLLEHLEWDSPGDRLVLLCRHVMSPCPAPYSEVVTDRGIDLEGPGSSSTLRVEGRQSAPTCLVVGYTHS